MADEKIPHVFYMPQAIDRAFRLKGEHLRERLRRNSQLSAHDQEVLTEKLPFQTPSAALVLSPSIAGLALVGSKLMYRPRSVFMQWKVLVPVVLGFQWVVPFFAYRGYLKQHARLINSLDDRYTCATALTESEEVQSSITIDRLLSGYTVTPKPYPLVYGRAPESKAQIISLEKTINNTNGNIPFLLPHSFQHGNTIYSESLTQYASINATPERASCGLNHVDPLRQERTGHSSLPAGNINHDSDPYNHRFHFPTFFLEKSKSASHQRLAWNT
ncbi:hypothetical protein FISHEDRAFT_61529 [Fistulina hepatica ATCC 64428]|uniref:Uncharacterized protein n=1 Tax=Fistulina hepatica ATCC 64428 TaxID=1128425 RepID=A0A0D7A1F7_9AGAR|nr:hypothetical protein FISHEDRAFT_61529 [Fistulina hepatica ATCC 64428]